MFSCKAVYTDIYKHAAIALLSSNIRHGSFNISIILYLFIVNISVQT